MSTDTTKKHSSRLRRIKHCFARLCLTFVMLGLLPCCFQDETWAGETPRFGGIEYFGSTLLAKADLLKMLAIKPGSSYESTEKAVSKLKAKLLAKNIHATISLIPANGNKVYLAVDIADSSTISAAPTRRLKNPSHVTLPNEVAFSILKELNARLETLLATQGKDQEDAGDGYLHYVDPAANRLAEKLQGGLQDVDATLHQVVESDPDGTRRAAAIQMLNWSGHPIRNCARFIPAIDDADPQVRAEATKYIYKRLNLLPTEFPYDSLVEALCHQLRRPTHADRAKATACLLALAQKKPETIYLLQDNDTGKLQEIAQESIIPSLQSGCSQLLALTKNPPPVKTRPLPKNLGTGF